MITEYDSCPDCWHQLRHHKLDKGCRAEDGGCSCRRDPDAVARLLREKLTRGLR